MTCCARSSRRRGRRWSRRRPTCTHPRGARSSRRRGRRWSRRRPTCTHPRGKGATAVRGRGSGVSLPPALRRPRPAIASALAAAALARKRSSCATCRPGCSCQTSRKRSSRWRCQQPLPSYLPPSHALSRGVLGVRTPTLSYSSSVCRGGAGLRKLPHPLRPPGAERGLRRVQRGGAGSGCDGAAPGLQVQPRLGGARAEGRALAQPRQQAARWGRGWRASAACGDDGPPPPARGRSLAQRHGGAATGGGAGALTRHASLRAPRPARLAAWAVAMAAQHWVSLSESGALAAAALQGMPMGRHPEPMAVRPSQPAHILPSGSASPIYAARVSWCHLTAGCGVGGGVHGASPCADPPVPAALLGTAPSGDALRRGGAHGCQRAGGAPPTPTSQRPFAPPGPSRQPHRCGLCSARLAVVCSHRHRARACGVRADAGRPPLPTVSELPVAAPASRGGEPSPVLRRVRRPPVPPP
jgi:hypothetical protein